MLSLSLSTTTTTTQQQQQFNNTTRNARNIFNQNLVTDFTAAGVPAIYPPSAMQYQPFYQYYSVPMVSIIHYIVYILYSWKIGESKVN